jgi:hypothetical protein
LHALSDVLRRRTKNFKSWLVQTRKKRAFTSKLKDPKRNHIDPSAKRHTRPKTMTTFLC